jgi:hypothetical protein
MSGLLGVGIIAATNVASVLLRRRRSIGTIIPGAVLEEIQLDEMVITEHPVERGAPITDHAYRRSAELIMKCGWSNAQSAQLYGFPIPGVSAGLVNAITSFGATDFVTETYEKLRKLQIDREIFTVVSGKRTYQNMMMQSLAVSTDETSENALMVVARMREVIIVATTTTPVAPSAQQAEPMRTGSMEPRGPIPTVQVEQLPPIAGPAPR